MPTLMTRSTRSSEPHRSRLAASVQDGGKASRAARNQQRRSKSSSRRKVHHPTGDGLAVDEATAFSQALLASPAAILQSISGRV